MGEKGDKGTQKIQIKTFLKKYLYIILKPLIFFNSTIVL